MFRLFAVAAIGLFLAFPLKVLGSNPSVDLALVAATPSQPMTIFQGIILGIVQGLTEFLRLGAKAGNTFYETFSAAHPLSGLSGVT